MATSGTTELGIALYPYVPRVAQFQEQLQTAWQAIHPGIELRFLCAEQWDGGYNTDPPRGADIFVFDAILLNEYIAGKRLLPLDGTDIPTQPAEFDQRAISSMHDQLQMALSVLQEPSSKVIWR